MMNKLEIAKLKIQPEDRMPKYPTKGNWYYIKWASQKYKKMRVELLSIRNDRVVVRTTTGKVFVTNTSDLLELEDRAIQNCLNRLKKTNIKRKLSL